MTSVVYRAVYTPFMGWRLQNLIMVKRAVSFEKSFLSKFANWKPRKFGKKQVYMFDLSYKLEMKLVDS